MIDPSGLKNTGITTVDAEMFKQSITKEELSDLPLKSFDGEIVIIDKYKQVRPAVKKLKECTVIGFDTETKPSFKKGVVNKVALLQLSTADHAFLFRINKLGLTSEIIKLLTDRRIIKPGVAIHDDIKGLQAQKRFDPKGFVELQNYAKDNGIQNYSLKKLAAIVLGFRISKSKQLSNWEALSLSEAQKVYAATDAWVALRIYEQFIDQGLVIDLM